jgi:uncharacterized protein
MRRRLRWRRVRTGELETIASRLAQWPAPAGGAVRHMFALSTIETMGADALRIAADDHRWAVAVVFPGRLLIPCGDAEAIASAGPPTRRWRLLVGDVDAGDAILSGTGQDPSLIVHDQRFLSVDHDRVPEEAQVPDPGLRRADPADLDVLARLAVRLHVDDEFGADPGPGGLRGYRQRLEQTVAQGMVWCVGPVGAPVCKVERSVSSHRWGVQLAGIVVDEEHRGSGLGTAAVAAAVRQALRDGPSSRPVSLHVRAQNTPALRAYARAGFVDRESWRLAVRG